MFEVIHIRKPPIYTGFHASRLLDVVNMVIHMKKLYVSLLALALAVTSATAQSVDTLLIQDFETSPSTPTWGYSGTPDDLVSGYSSVSAGPPNSPLGIDGSRAWHVDDRDNGNTLTFDNFTLPHCYDSFMVSLRIAAMNMGGSSGGPDFGDYVSIEVSTDGGSSYYERVRVRGWSGSQWPYSATGVAEVNYLPKSTETFGPNSSGYHSEGYSNVKIHVSNGESQIRIRIKVVSTVSSDDWLIDNLVLTGIDDGVAGYPAIACPNDITVNHDTAACTGLVSFTTPVGFDSCSNGSGSDTFNFTGGIQTFVVPSGIDSVTIIAYGAQGGADPPTAGGMGGSAVGKLDVTAGDTLYVYVGGKGTDGPGSGQNCNLPGGFNGGGGTGDTCCSNAGGGAGAGGGASDVRMGGMSLANRVIVAGGGGGAGSSDQGGAGGGLVGGDGTSYQSVTATGGTQSAGGQAGGHYIYHTCNIGTDGELGQGGKGDGNDGGGGGGGYYGGGGGPNNGGGAGGSSYIALLDSASTSQGVRSGNGMIVITYYGSASTLTTTQLTGLASGSNFPMGTTTNSYQVISGSDTGRCSFNVTVENTRVGNLEVAAPNSYTSPSGNHTWDSSGIYVDTLAGAGSNGCDSLIVIELTIVNVLFVDADMSSSGNGQSWSTAYKTLEEALTVANSFGDYIEVWLKKGTYYPGGQGNGGRDSSFVIVNPLAVLLGGFAGVELNADLRNPAVNVTTLCGDIGTLNDSSDNCYHILTLLPNWDTLNYSESEEGGYFPPLFIDGITFRDANANGNSKYTYDGTSLYRHEGGAIVVAPNIKDNDPYTAPYIYRCTFEHNYADYGSAVFIQGKNSYDESYITDCTLEDNTSIYGTVFIDGSDNGQIWTEIDACAFANNTSKTSGAAIYLYSYGGYYTSPAVYNCVFSENNATSNAGAIYTNGYVGDCEPFYANNTFYKNNAGASGGALYNIGTSGNCEPSLTNNIFYGNMRGGDRSHKHSELFNYNASLISEYNSFQKSSGSYSSTYLNSLGSATGNLFAQNPGFKDTSNLTGSDNIWRTGDDGLALSVSSAMIDEGDDISWLDYDILFNQIMNDRDLGAYEYVDCGLYVKLATTAKTHTAVHAVEDEGYVCYCNSDNELLLALDTAGTGAVISPSQVKLYIGSPSTLSYNTSGGLISNPDGGVVLERRWDVDPTTQPSSPVNVIYFYTNDEYNDIVTALSSLTSPTYISSPSQLQFYKVTGGSTDTFPNPHDSTVVGIVLVNASYPSTTTWLAGVHGVQDHSAEYQVAHFSGGGGGGGAGSSPLPVELLEFNAKLNKSSQVVNLDWSTASEFNNAYFKVEKSNDGYTWLEVSTVPGSGTTDHIKTYSDVDPDPFTGISFYRLRQVDFDGTTAYSPIRMIDNRLATDRSVLVYPNPTEGYLQISFPEFQEEPGHQVQLIDNMGRVIMSEFLTDQHPTIDMTEYPHGFYVLLIDGKEAHKIISK